VMPTSRHEVDSSAALGVGMTRCDWFCLSFERGGESFGRSREFWQIHVHGS
jgi:hypothetical protein